MYFDYNNLLSDKQTLIDTAADVTYSTSCIDLYNGGSAVQKIGPGELVKIVAQITTAVVSAGAATVDIELVVGSSATVGATNIAVVQAMLAVPKATLVAGYAMLFVIPYAQLSQRYLRMRYTINTADTTAGAITVGLLLDYQTADSGWTAVNGF